MSEWTAGDVAALMANPIYAVEIDPRLGTAAPTMTDDEWVDANVESFAWRPARWLTMLLRVLKGEEFPAGTPEAAFAARCDPSGAVVIVPDLLFPHETILTEADWIAVNVKSAGEIGAAPWLHNLLSVLAGNYVAGPDDNED